jgi:hypothetical protein
MKLKTLFLANTIIATLFGLAFLFHPSGLMSLYGVSLGIGAVLIARLFGAALLGYGILTWLVRNAYDSAALKAIVIALFLSDLAGCIVAIFGQLSGATNALGWSTVAIYALLAVGFGVFALKKPASEE